MANSLWKTNERTGELKHLVTGARLKKTYDKRSWCIKGTWVLRAKDGRVVAQRPFFGQDKTVPPTTWANKALSDAKLV